MGKVAQKAAGRGQKAEGKGGGQGKVSGRTQEGQSGEQCEGSKDKAGSTRSGRVGVR